MPVLPILIQDTTLLLLSALSLFRTYDMMRMHAASRLFSWRMELLAPAGRQFSPNYAPLLYVCFVHIFVLLFLVSERSGRRKPPAERSALVAPTFSEAPHIPHPIIDSENKKKRSRPRVHKKKRHPTFFSSARQEGYTKTK